jgi:hypothetical protein
MKYLFMLLGMLLVAVPIDTAIAQTESEALVTGTVEQSLALIPSDGDWGLFASGNIYVITPAGFKDPPGPGEGPGVVVSPVAFEIDGSAGTDVQVDLVLPSAFVSDDESGELPLSNWHFGWNYDNDPAASYSDAGQVTGDRVILSIGGEAVSGLFLGATVSVPNESFPGVYTAQVIASVIYLGN